jgi:hypothetical protein
VQQLDKSVDMYGLLEASFDQMDQEFKTPQSQKYSSSKYNAEFRYRCGKCRLIDSNASWKIITHILGDFNS